MTVKDYLRKVEIANEVIELSGRDSYYEKDYKFYMDFDNYKTYSFKSYNEFKEFVKEEFIPEFTKEILNREFELNNKYIINDSSVEFCIE